MTILVTAALIWIGGGFLIFGLLLLRGWWQEAKDERQWVRDWLVRDQLERLWELPSRESKHG